MASDLSNTPKMIVPYEWILENVENQTSLTIASKMISFRGEKVFRVGLKNHAKLPILFFMAINLRKIGMKVEDVKYGFRGSDLDPATMEKMTKEGMGGEGNLQLFTMTFPNKIVGNRTFIFRICIVGADPCYSFQLSDRLAKDQLWGALQIQKHLADVVLIVKDMVFHVHKAILAARSPVFADEFEKIQPGKDVPQQMRIDGVEPLTMGKLLHFIYKGEPTGTLADEELLKLADRYQLATLSSLCKLALEKIDAMHMAILRKRINSNPEELSFSKILPEKETEMFFDRTTPTFRCPWLLKKSQNGKTICVMQYQNENIVIAYFTEEIDSQVSRDDSSKPVIHFTCAKHRSFGLQIEDVYCGMQGSGTRGYRRWLKMEPKHQQKNAELLHFTVPAHLDFSKEKLQSRVYFDVKIVSKIGNYNHRMSCFNSSTGNYTTWVEYLFRLNTEISVRYLHVL